MARDRAPPTVQSGMEAEGNEDPSGNLIQGRARRTTAGRNMSALINAEADDDLNLLFAESEDDNDFSMDADGDAEMEDDMALESDSDEEDQGPNADDDDFEGEKEVEKQAKAERKKRKNQEGQKLQAMRKKVKIDPTVVSTTTTTAATDTAARQRKKSERISWLPTPEEGPTRSSSRRQTMENKEVTHAKLKDSEEKRVRLIASMEEAARKKALHKPKFISQEDRLAEAERVERHNSKSLNRWEETEKKKAEERKARIEALQNRRLEGPVMSQWSGIATWTNGTLTHIGKVDVTPKQEKEEATRRRIKKAEKEKLAAEQKPALIFVDGAAAPKRRASVSEIPTPVGIDDSEIPSHVTENQPDEASNNVPENAHSSIAQPEAIATRQAFESNHASPSIISPIPRPAPAGPDSVSVAEHPLDSVPQAGVPSNTVDNKPMDRTSKEKTDQTGAGQPYISRIASTDPNAKETALPLAPNLPFASQGIPTASPATALPTPEQNGTQFAPSQLGLGPAPMHMEQQQQQPDRNEVAPTPQPPPKIEHTGRSLIVLENFDEEYARKPEYSIYFNSKKPPRLSKTSSSLCAITSLPSRYRDPETSLPYANAYAYREIQNAISQKYSWSPMLGCYVGPAGVAARGVPERFLGGSSTGPKPDTKEGGLEGVADEGSIAVMQGAEGSAIIGDGIDTPMVSVIPGASVPATPVVSAAGTAVAPVPPVATTPMPVALEAGGAMDVDKP